MAYFYSHLIEIDSIVIKLDELDLQEMQRHHLACLVDSAIHHLVLDVILSKLSPVDKKIFWEMFKGDPNDLKLMEFLTEKIDNIEMEIKEAVEQLKKELHQDIQKAESNG